MPYLFQNGQNRVENIKRKFESSHFNDTSRSNSCVNYQSYNSPSKTKAIQVLKNGNVENERDNSGGKHHMQSDKHIGKLEVNKVDGKAAVRRSPAFRRDKLNYGKSASNLCNLNENPLTERKKINRLKGIKSDTSESVNTVKLENDNFYNQFHKTFAESNIFQFSQNNNNKSNSQDYVNSKPNLISNSIDDPLTENNVETKSRRNHIISDKILVQCSQINKSDRPSSNCDSKNDLKLTDSIRLALKSPLPKGPPPKKPPRTFLHKSKDCFETNNLSTTATSGQVKEDSMLRIKLEKIEQVVKGLDSRNQTTKPWEADKAELGRFFSKLPTLDEPDDQSIQGSLGKCTDGFSLNSLSCFSTDHYKKSLNCEIEMERQSSFYIDCPRPGKLDIKTSSSCKDLGLNRTGKKFDSEPIYDLPCVPKKKNSFESFGKSSKENGKGTGKPQQLHYMCTDVVNSLQDDPKPVKFPIRTPDRIPRPEIEKKINFPAHLIKKNCHESNENEAVNRESLEQTRNPLGNEDKVKIIMDDAFNMRGMAGESNVSSLDVESDSESGSSGLDETASGENCGSFESERKFRDRSPNVPSSKGDQNTSAMRKTYVKRVSSNLLNRPYFSRNQSNDSFTHLFESCILVGLTLAESKTTVPYIKSIFPSNVRPPPLIESLCFPDASTWTQSSCNQQQGEQYYSLVITNENSDRKFGYCRRVLPEGGNFCLPLVYCIISPHRANGFYYKVLQELESRHGSSEIQEFIKQLYECNFPGPGQSLKFKKILEEVSVKVSPFRECLPSTLVRRPCDVRLEERDLSHLLQQLKISVFLKVFGSLLLERKVLLLGRSLRNLSSCIEALQSLLVPFSWQHTFIPVLPNHLTEMCDAPTPYVIGLQKSTTTTEFLSNMNFEEGIMIDLEESLIVKCCGDEGSIVPQRLIKGLKTALNLAMSAPKESDNDRNVLISEAFIRFFVEICGNYSCFIVKQQDGKKIFQKEEFVESVASFVQPFLDWFVETAMFRSFIQERIQSDIEDLFKRRAREHREESDKGTMLISKNCKGMNSKVKSLGHKLKDLTLFAK